jgi:hypothetical protein
MKPKRLTKQEFLQQALHGQLTSDRALARLTEQLHEYEKKYQMRSEVFYKLIVGTPAEDQPDFLAWAICYRSYFRAVQAQLSAEGALPHALKVVKHVGRDRSADRG